METALHERVTTGVSHMAFSLAPGTLTPEWREAFLAFYGRFGWSEIENSPRPDRFTVAIGGGAYLNLREKAEPMTCTGYEHFGMFVESTERVEELYAALRSRDDIELEDMVANEGGIRSFRFRYLLPVAMEIQWFPPGMADESPRRWGRSMM